MTIPDVLVVNQNGGMKYDGQKIQPTLLFKSMPYAVKRVIEVLCIGAKKYNADNWKKVENERYHDALLRHALAYFSGEKYDEETGKEHLAHLVCCALFLIEKEKESE